MNIYKIILMGISSVAIISCLKNSREIAFESGGFKIYVGDTRKSVENVMGIGGMSLLKNFNTFYYPLENSYGTLGVTYFMKDGAPSANDSVLSASKVVVRKKEVEFIKSLNSGKQSQ